jgi:hypothetical protein
MTQAASLSSGLSTSSSLMKKLKGFLPERWQDFVLPPLQRLCKQRETECDRRENHKASRDFRRKSTRF